MAFWQSFIKSLAALIRRGRERAPEAPSAPEPASPEPAAGPPSSGEDRVLYYSAPLAPADTPPPPDGWTRRAQERLAAAGLYHAPLDGIAGPATWTALFRHMGAGPVIAKQLGPAAARWLPRYGIDRPLRIAHWLGQMAHESAGFSRLIESLYYSSAERIRAVWPRRFPTAADALPYIHQPERLANLVYANRLGNGPPESCDGWRYRGRGLIQLTGRANYRATGLRLGLPLESEPELAGQPEAAVWIAAEWWQRHRCNEWADRDDARAISGMINRGNPAAVAHGLPDRIARTNRAKEVLL